MGQGEQANAGGTDARSKHGDALRIAPKVADVLADPAQALDLVQQPIIPLGGLVTCAQKAWKTTRGESHSQKGTKNLRKGKIFCLLSFF